MVLRKVNHYLGMVAGLFLLCSTAMASEDPHKVILLTECGQIVYIIDMQGGNVRSAPITYFEGRPDAAHNLARIMSSESTGVLQIDIAADLGRVCV